MTAATQTIDQLWQRYTKRRTPKLRNALVEHYLPLARSIARHYAERVPATVSVDELESDAMLGLIDAVEKFDPARGFRFSTYATTRIRGAVLDAIRDRDDTSRYVRLQTRRYTEAENVLRAETGLPPKPGEIRKRLRFTKSAFRLVERNQAHLTFSINTRFYDKEGQEHSLEPIEAADPFIGVAHRDEVDQLLRALPTKLRRIMHLRYIKGESAERIGQRYGVGACRISQQHRTAMGLIRSAISRPRVQVA